MEGLHGDDRTFRINFTTEGVGKLRETVKEKLKEFMGDHTDETLVEYVVVLLRNGKSNDEARKELNVFLGAECVSFISWLWDHLSLNLHQYSQTEESSGNDVAEIEPKLNELSRNRRKREWKELVREEMVPFSRSIVTENLHLEEKINRRTNLVRKYHSPRPRADRKRSRQDEQQQTKRNPTSHPVISPPNRLLQFAVQDALKTMQPTSSRTASALKRFRSDVSRSAQDSYLKEIPPMAKPVARVSSALSTALKAAAEAAEDVIKVRCSGNFFGRQGRDSMDAVGTIRLSSSVIEEGEYVDFDQIPGSNHLDCYHSGEYKGEFSGNSALHHDGFGEVGIVRPRVLDGSQNRISATKDKNSLMVRYTVAQDSDEIVKKTRVMGQESPSISAGNASRKTLNISVNVNTCKPPNYETPRKIAVVESLTVGEKADVCSGKSSVRLLRENSAAPPHEEKDVTCAGVQKDVRKSVMSTPGRPDDLDTRIVFLGNVHFAATKDTLSCHFNKFGEVLKVIIVTDAATGKPTGSAYVEFVRKESAELALSLNGTSFMSRMLKVVRRSSVHHEGSPLMVWPRIARAFPFASGPGRVPFPRGSVLASPFRGRLPIIPGARSLQWKRASPTARTSEGAKSSSSLKDAASRTLQNLT